MRKYQNTAEPTSASPAAPAAGQVAGDAASQRVPSMYRTWIAIGAVAATLLAIIVITLGSGRGHPEGGKFARVVVVAADGLHPAVLRSAMASNKAPNLQGLTSLGNAAVCGGSGDACALSGGVPELLTGILSTSVAANISVMSFLQKAKQHQLRPSVIAPELQFSGSNFVASQSRCERVGVLDRECSQDACWDGKKASCNRDFRYAYGGDNSQGVFDLFVSAAKEYSDVIYVQLNANQAAGEASSFSDASLRYLSSIYLVDAVVGNIVTVIRDRTAANFENWLFIFTAPQSGIAGDAAVPFFLAGFTNSAPIQLTQFKTPLRTVDVYPTVLKWLGIVDKAAIIDGVVQGVCTSGVLPGKCA